MKSTGIVRRVDELGRIVLPAELRRTLDISVKDQMEIFVDGNAVVLKKYAPTCIFCDSGVEHQAQCSGQPFKNSTVLSPSPS